MRIKGFCIAENQSLSSLLAIGGVDISGTIMSSGRQRNIKDAAGEYCMTPNVSVSCCFQTHGCLLNSSVCVCVSVFACVCVGGCVYAPVCLRPCDSVGRRCDILDPVSSC